MSEIEKQKQVDLKETPDNSDDTFSSSQNEQSKSLEVVGQKIGNHYQILQLLGTGGLGAVYKAQHQLLGTYCAVKLLHSGKLIDGKAIQRFQREAEAAVELRHPYIAGVQEFGVHDDAPFIVMEFVEGTPLDQVIKAEGRLDPKRVLRILKQTAEALSYAHKQRVIHRDIKPANIIVCKDKNGDEVAKIIDFGIAKVIDENDARALTQTGEVFGTPKYMSPEQCQGRKADGRADLYSLGCVAYEMLSGSPPFTADSALELIMKHVNEPAKELKKIPELNGIQHVIARLLAKDPNHRHDSPESLLLDLQLIERGSKPTPFIDPTSMRRKAFKGVTYGLLIGALALFGYTCLNVFLNTIIFQTMLIQLDPKNAAAYAQRAMFLDGHESYSNAILDYNKAIELEPKNGEYYNLRANTHWARNDIGSAFIDYGKAIELMPELPEPYVARARILLEQGKYKEAIRDSTSAIERDSEGNVEMTESYVVRATAENRLNQFQKALADADKALDLQAKFPFKAGIKEYWMANSAQEKAIALINLGRPQEAIPVLDASIELFPLSHNLLFTRSTAKLALNDTSSALKDIEQALTLSKNNRAYLKLRDALKAHKGNSTK